MAAHSERDTIVVMLRATTYRTAAVGLAFTALWFVLGLFVISTPVPGALGIASQLFVAWLLLFLGITAVTGALLIAAAANGRVAAPRRQLRPVAPGQAQPGETRAQPGRTAPRRIVVPGATVRRRPLSPDARPAERNADPRRPPNTRPRRRDA